MHSELFMSLNGKGHANFAQNYKIFLNFACVSV